MAVVKRKPCPRTSDLVKKEKVVSEEVPRKPRTPIHELMKEKRMQLEVSEHEKVQEVQETERLDNREEKEVIIDNTREINKNYNLEMFQPAASKTVSRSSLKVGIMSVVNSNGRKRVMLSKDLMDKLSNPTNVAMSFSEENIAIGVTLPNNNNQLTVKPSGKKGVIYSAGIVTEITDKYKLDFSNRTSIILSEVEYIENDGLTVAIINAR
jgi:hypothetical protein